MISWPFFGSNRGELQHPDEINRGPWTSTSSYLESSVKREIDGVQLENEGKSAPHRLHLDPAEILASRHHHLQAVPDDQSDDSDEYDLDESDEEWEGPGDAMYRDYRRMQRTTFLVAHLKVREQAVRAETERFKRIVHRLRETLEEKDKRYHAHVPASAPRAGVEEFALDCHDLSLENIFVDPDEPSRIVSYFYFQRRGAKRHGVKLC